MTALIRYDAACAALADAKNIDEVKDIFNKTEALRAYARMANDTQLELDAAEIRVRAERRLGAMLAAQKEADGLSKGGRPITKITGSKSEPVISAPTLADAGIDKKLSSRAQKLARVDETEFEGIVTNLRTRISVDRGRVSMDIMRERDKAAERELFVEKISNGGTADDLVALATSGYRASVILADPPWHFMTRSDKGEGRSANQHYTTNPLDEIKALPVAALASPDCVLLIWMVDWCPGAALEVIKAWGFEHKTTGFTWAKTNKGSGGMFMGQGYWTRANPESCWLATKGSPKRVNADVRQLIIAPVSEHSRKPDEVYARIEQLVRGPYLELYARRPREGWTTWGNELPPPGVEDENQDRHEYEFNQDSGPLSVPEPEHLAKIEIPEFLRRKPEGRP